MTFYEQLVNMQKTKNYDLDKLRNIANSISEDIGEAKMWTILVPSLENQELYENLVYLCNDFNVTGPALCQASDRDFLDELAMKLENEFGASQLWCSIVQVFSIDELVNNLEYIANECNI